MEGLDKIEKECTNFIEFFFHDHVQLIELILFRRNTFTKVPLVFPNFQNKHQSHYL